MEKAGSQIERRNEEKQKRMAGRSYLGFRRAEQKNKEKWIQDVPKEERKIGPPCNSEYCAKGIDRHCPAFDEEKRQRIFCHFWNELDWAGKKKFVRSLVILSRVKNKEVSRKGDSKLYHLFDDNERVPVCRITFLNTLGLKESMVRWWLTNEDVVKKTKKPVKSLNVDSYIDLLPTAPPKCSICRNMSTKMYIDCDGIKNQYQLYNKYVKDMRAAGVNPASRKTFSLVFKGKNLSIFKPKNETDVCDMVSQHNQELSAVETFSNVNLQVFDNITGISQDLMANITYNDAQW